MHFFINLNNQKLLCSELIVKDYKNLLKTIFGDEPDKELFVENLTMLFAKLTNKPQSFFKEELSIFDLFLILIQIRINSLGDAIQLNVIKDEKQMNLELRLDWVVEDIKTILNQIFDETIGQNKMKLTMGVPSLNRLDENNEEQYLSYLQTISIVEQLNIKNNSEARQLFDKLSPKNAKKVIENFNRFAEKITNLNFLARYGIDNQTLTLLPSKESLLFFAKLIFNEDLSCFYDNMFYLSHLGHLSLDYIEQCSAGEYTYFVRKLEQTLSQKTPSPAYEDFELDEDPVEFEDKSL